MISVEVIQGYAHERAAVNAAAGSVDVRQSGRGRQSPDFVGVTAELALRALIPYATFPSLTEGKDSGWDALLPSGETVDVKGSTAMEPHLLVPRHQLPVEVDYLLLARVYRVRDDDGHTVGWDTRWIGWLTGTEFMERAAFACSVCGLEPKSGKWVHHTELNGMATWLS